jgi:hypothetical protein
MTTSKGKRSSCDIDLSAYEALDFDGLARHANYRVIAYREDMLHVLDKKDAAAIIYQIIFRWLTEKRRPDILSELEARQKANQPPLTPQEVEERMWVYMSYNDFARESGGAIGYNTVIRTLDYLLQKGIIERRENSNPKFTEYEYRINKQNVRELLKGLPTFPYYLSKGMKGKNAPATPTQMGTGSPYPDGGGTPTQMGTGHTQMGTPPTQMGADPYPNGGTSQKKTQNLPQDSSQGIPQQQQSTHPLASQEAIATALSILGNLSEEEVALVLAYRQQANEGTPQPLGEMPPAAAAPSKRAEIITQANEQHEETAPEIATAIQRPDSDALLTDEVIVSLYEYKHGTSYDEEERPFQLQAARALLGLRLTLSVDLLERVYDECCDKWWRDHYGELHVSHLVEKEKNHGQRRIVRLLKRVQSRSQVTASVAGAGETPASTPTGNLEPRMVMWKGHLVPEEQAYAEGYEGGFERFKKGEHPDDDLEATLKRLQAEGKLPMFEGVSNNG